MTFTNEQLLNWILIVLCSYVGSMVLITLYRVCVLISWELHIWRCDRRFKKEALKREQREELISLYLSKLDGAENSRLISKKLFELGRLTIYDIEPAEWPEMRKFLETLKS